MKIAIERETYEGDDWTVSVEINGDLQEIGTAAGSDDLAYAVAEAVSIIRMAERTSAGPRIITLGANQ